MSPIFTPPRTWCYFAQLVVLAFTLNSPERVQALVVGAAVLPHGDFAFDPSLVGNKNHSLELHKGAQAVGAAVAALRPDIIVLTTPHGIESERDFAFYRNTNGSGFAHLGDDLHNASFPGYDVNLNISMNPSIVHNLTASLLAMDTRANVSTLLSFADGEAQALRWGEVVPLKLVFDQYKELAAPLAGKTPELPSVVVWSVPSRRYTETDTMVGSGELTRLGLNLATALERLDERVVVLVSADLAHTHLASGPYVCPFPRTFFNCVLAACLLANRECRCFCSLIVSQADVPARIPRILVMAFPCFFCHVGTAFQKTRNLLTKLAAHGREPSIPRSCYRPLCATQSTQSPADTQDLLCSTAS